ASARDVRGGAVGRSVQDRHAGSSLLVQPERRLAAVRPGQMKVRFHFAELRVAFGVEPDRHGAGGADQFAVENLKAARVTRVAGIVALVKIAVDPGQGAAELGRDGPRLFS